MPRTKKTSTNAVKKIDKQLDKLLQEKKEMEGIPILNRAEIEAKEKELDSKKKTTKKSTSTKKTTTKKTTTTKKAAPKKVDEVKEEVKETKKTTAKKSTTPKKTTTKKTTTKKTTPKKVEEVKEEKVVPKKEEAVVVTERKTKAPKKSDVVVVAERKVRSGKKKAVTKKSVTITLEEKENLKKKNKDKVSESTLKLNKLVEEIRDIYSDASNNVSVDKDLKKIIEEDKNKKKQRIIEDETSIIPVGEITDENLYYNKLSYKVLNVIMWILFVIFMILFIAFIAFIIYVCTY